MECIDTRFGDYVKNNEECVKMDEESWDVLGKGTNSPELIIFFMLNNNGGFVKFDNL